MHTIVCFYSAFYRPLFPITLSLSLTLSLCHSHSLCLSFTVTVFAAETGNQTRRNDLKLKTKKKKKNEIKVSQLQKSMDQEYLHEASEHWCRALIKIEFSSLSHVLCGLFRLVFVFFFCCVQFPLICTDFNEIFIFCCNRLIFLCTFVHMLMDLFVADRRAFFFWLINISLNGS